MEDENFSHLFQDQNANLMVDGNLIFDGTAPPGVENDWDPTLPGMQAVPTDNTTQKSKGYDSLNVMCNEFTEVNPPNATMDPQDLDLGFLAQMYDGAAINFKDYLSRPSQKTTTCHSGAARKRTQQRTISGLQRQASQPQNDIQKELQTALSSLEKIKKEVGTASSRYSLSAEELDKCVHLAFEMATRSRLSLRQFLHQYHPKEEVSLAPPVPPTTAGVTQLDNIRGTPRMLSGLELEIAAKYGTFQPLKCCYENSKTKGGGGRYFCLTGSGWNCKRKAEWIRHEHSHFPQMVWPCLEHYSPSNKVYDRVFQREKLLEEHQAKENCSVRPKVNVGIPIVNSEFPRTCSINGCFEFFAKFNHRLEHFTIHFENNIQGKGILDDIRSNTHYDSFDEDPPGAGASGNDSFSGLDYQGGSNSSLNKNSNGSGSNASGDIRHTGQSSRSLFLGMQLNQSSQHTIIEADPRHPVNLRAMIENREYAFKQSNSPRHFITELERYGADVERLLTCDARPGNMRYKFAKCFVIPQTALKNLMHTLRMSANTWTPRQLRSLLELQAESTGNVAFLNDGEYRTVDVLRVLELGSTESLVPSLTSNGNTVPDLASSSTSSSSETSWSGFVGPELVLGSHDDLRLSSELKQIATKNKLSAFNNRKSEPLMHYLSHYDDLTGILASGTLYRRDYNQILPRLVNELVRRIQNGDAASVIRFPIKEPPREVKKKLSGCGWWAPPAEKIEYPSGVECTSENKRIEIVSTSDW